MTHDGERRGREGGRMGKERRNARPRLHQRHGVDDTKRDEPSLAETDRVYDDGDAHGDTAADREAGQRTTSGR
jgi:hypothetical protein